MTKGLFVTATGTDVGKTYVTALLVKRMRQLGLAAGYYKAALSGAEVTEQGLWPGDAAWVQQVAGLTEDPRRLVSYIYQEAVSPHLAAHFADRPLELAQVMADYQRLGKRYDYLVVEGSGGIVCPLRYDQQVIMLEDLVQELALPTIVVADAALGTINATILTLEYLARRQIAVRGVIVNRYQGSVMEQDNLQMIEALSGVPVLTQVAPAATELALEKELLLSLFT